MKKRLQLIKIKSILSKIWIKTKDKAMGKDIKFPVPKKVKNCFLAVTNNVVTMVYVPCIA